MVKPGNKIAGCCLLIGLVSLTGCFSVVKDSETCRGKIVQGQYGPAGDIAVSRAKRGGVDESFWSLWGASAKLFNGRQDEALTLFDRTEWRFHDYDMQSLAEKGLDQAKWLTVNDCLLPYNPVGHDRIFLNVYKALIYANKGDPDGARVELNRVRQQQYNYLYARASVANRLQKQAEEKQAEAAKTFRENGSASLISQAESVSDINGVPDMSTVPGNVQPRLTTLSNQGFPGVSPADQKLFGALSGLLNPYAAHFCGLFRCLNGDRSLGDLSMAAALAPDVELFRRDAMRLESGHAPEGMIWVYVEDGLAPRRQEWRLDLPLGIFRIKPAYTGVAFPKLIPGQAAFGGYTILSNQGSIPLQPITRVESLIRAEFKEDLKWIVMRELVRVAAKTAAQIAVLTAAEHREDHARQRGSSTTGADLMLLAGYGMGVYQALTTEADIRCWALLPQTVYGASLMRPASGNLRIVTQSGKAFQLTVPPCRNAIVWVRCPSGQAPVSGIVIPFGAASRPGKE